MLLRSSFALCLATAFAGAVSLGLPAARAGENEPLHALIVGGGPDPRSNAAQIEGHARYVAQLLPAGARHVVLFADGKPDTQTVSSLDKTAEGLAKSALSVLLPDGSLGAPLLHHPADLGLHVNGASSREAIHRAITSLLPAKGAGKSSAPLLLYFAGHGGQGGSSDANAEFDLWDGKRFSVRDFSAEIARLPAHAPVVVVMAQCYSGAFANLLLRDGNPNGERVPQNLAGFFSARSDREAAGCGWDTAEEDYQDFSSYFFGALSGFNRFGHPVTGADFDGNGVVSLHEAFCYALGHDPSIDTPVCTSELFLRRFAYLADDKVYTTPYAEALQGASAGQRAALDALSQRLGLEGEQRAQAAYDRLTFRDPIGLPPQLAAQRAAVDKLNDLRSATLAALFKDWQALRWQNGSGYTEAVAGATKALVANPALCHDVLAASKASEEADGVIDVDEAYLCRFVDLYAGIVMAKNLRAHGEATVKANFERLWTAEQQTLALTYPQPAK